MVYKGTVGLLVLLDCRQDISSAEDPKIRVKKPSGTVLEWTPTIIQRNGLTTLLGYVTQVSDLDEIGVYTIQPQLTLGGWRGYCKEASLEVSDII